MEKEDSVRFKNLDILRKLKKINENSVKTTFNVLTNTPKTSARGLPPNTSARGLPPNTSAMVLQPETSAMVLQPETSMIVSSAKKSAKVLPPRTSAMILPSRTSSISFRDLNIDTISHITNFSLLGLYNSTKGISKSSFQQ